METGWFTCDVAVIIRDTLDTGDNANLLRTGVVTLDPIGDDPTGPTVRVRHRQIYHVDATTGLLLNPETGSTGPHEAGVGMYRVTLETFGHVLYWDVALTKGHTKTAPLNLAMARETVPAPGVTVNALPLPTPPSTGTWTLVWGPDGAAWKAGAPTSVKLTVAQGSTTTGSGTATIDSNGTLQLGLTLPATGPHTHTVADVTGLQTTLDGYLPKTWTAIPAGDDLNTITTDGSRSTASSSSIAKSLINGPGIDTAFELTVDAVGSSIVQRATSLAAPHKVMLRRRYAGVWTAWETDSWLRDTIPNGTDLNACTAPGMWGVYSSSAARTLINGPSNYVATGGGPAVLLVEKNSPSGRTTQTWKSIPTSLTADAPTVRRSEISAGVWTAWVREDPRGSQVTTNVDVLTLPEGQHYVPLASVAKTLVNRPNTPQANWPAWIEVRWAGAFCHIRWTSIESVAQPLRSFDNYRDASGNWSGWQTAGRSLEGAASLNVVAPAVSAAQRFTRGAIIAASTPSTLKPWAWSAPTGTACTIPTHDGSGQGCHPAVCYFPDGKFGYRYWMAFTPYPYGNDAHEDPNIVASNDGDTWVVPSGLSNPLDDLTGTAAAGKYNSDTSLVAANGDLVVLWRSVDATSGNAEQFWIRTSSDGVTWTPKVSCYQPPTGRSFVAPTLVKMPDKWRMYAVETTVSPNELVYVESSDAIPTTWTAPKMCASGPKLPDRDWWHADIQLTDSGQWVGLMNDTLNGISGKAGDVMLMLSEDGITWEVSPVPLLPRISPSHSWIYKSGFVPRGSGGSLWLDVFYSAYDAETRTFRVYRTTAQRDPA